MLTLAVVACNKYDDTELRNKISAMETRISTLESTVSGLQTIVSALQTGKRVTSVEKSGNAYVITFTDGSKATIESETIGIKADGDVYYWAINGDFLKDKDGNKIPVSAGGIVPVFRNNNGSLEVSTDNGKTWASVLVNEGNFSVEETDTTVTITVAGQKVVLYKDVPFTLNIQVPDGFSIEAGQTGELAYTISGVAEGVETEVGVLNEGKAFSAEVVPSSNQAGTIKITNMQADGSVKVIVYATDHMGKTDIKAILFTVIPAKPVEIVFEAVLDVQKVSADGGTCTLNVKADEDYTCTVEAAAQSWLTIVGTKAKHEDTITLSVAKNETTSQRSGTVTVASTTSDKKVNVVVLQEAGEAPQSDYLNNTGAYTIVATGKYQFYDQTKKQWVVKDGEVTKKCYIMPAEDAEDYYVAVTVEEYEGEEYAACYLIIDRDETTGALSMSYGYNNEWTDETYGEMKDLQCGNIYYQKKIYYISSDDSYTICVADAPKNGSFTFNAADPLDVGLDTPQEIISIEVMSMDSSDQPVYMLDTFPFPAVFTRTGDLPVTTKAAVSGLSRVKTHAFANREFQFFAR